MHRLAHRVRPALRTLRAVHTGPQEPAAAAAASGSRNVRWGVAAAFAVGTAVGYLASGEKKPLKTTIEITREVKAPKPHVEPAPVQNGSAVEPTSLVASSTDAPSADASVTTDNVLTESHPGEKHASVEVEDGDDATALEGEVPKVAAPYDPETGEFNWDCPCLGGLPDTICGEQFKDSFRCFVKSEAEPKGMDCIDAFNAMQQCFREHPEVYAREIEIYDEVDKEGEGAGVAAESQLQNSVTSPKSTDATPSRASDEATAPVERPREMSKSASGQTTSTPPKRTSA